MIPPNGEFEKIERFLNDNWTVLMYSDNIRDVIKGSEKVGDATEEECTEGKIRYWLHKRLGK